MPSHYPHFFEFDPAPKVSRGGSKLRDLLAHGMSSPCTDQSYTVKPVLKRPPKGVNKKNGLLRQVVSYWRLTGSGTYIKYAYVFVEKKKKSVVLLVVLVG